MGQHVECVYSDQCINVDVNLDYFDQDVKIDDYFDHQSNV